MVIPSCVSNPKLSIALEFCGIEVKEDTFDHRNMWWNIWKNWFFTYLDYYYCYIVVYFLIPYSCICIQFFERPWYSSKNTSQFEISLCGPPPPKGLRNCQASPSFYSLRDLQILRGFYPSGRSKIRESPPPLPPLTRLRNMLEIYRNLMKYGKNTEQVCGKYEGDM